MLFYLPTMISLVLNVFMLFGLNFEIQLSMTLGLAYSVFLFLYFLAQKREANIIILLSAFGYWFLLSFVLNAQSTMPIIVNNGVLTFSIIFNLVAALLFFIAAILLAWILPVSPFSTLLLSHSFLSAVMYFNGLALNYFIYIYLGSMLLLVILTALNTKGPQFNFWPLIIIWFSTFSLFIANELALTAGYYSFSPFQNYNFIVMFSTWGALIPAFVSEIYGLCYNFDVVSENSSGLTFRETTLNPTQQFCDAMWRGGRLYGGNSTTVSGRVATNFKPLYGWSSPSTVVIPESLNEQKLYAATLSSHITSLWGRIGSFTSFSFINSTPPNFEAKQLIKESTIEPPHKTFTSNTSDLNSKPVLRSLSYSSLINNSVWGRTTLFTSISTTGVGSVSHNNILGNRNYSSYSAPLSCYSLGYPLEANFTFLDDADTLYSKIGESNENDFYYTFIDQKRIPILQGDVGRHHTALLLIACNNTPAILVVLTTSPGIRPFDSTYNFRNKAAYNFIDLLGNKKISNQEVTEKLLWEKKEKTVTASDSIKVGKIQKLAPTLCIITNKELIADLQDAGEKKDSRGTEKVHSISSELKRELQVLIDRSRIDEDPSKIKVVEIKYKKL